MIRAIFIIVLLCFRPQLHAQTKVDQQALRQLVQVCRDTHSTGLSIWVDGHPYKDYSFDTVGRAETFSGQKSLISLAIGKLITDGKLASIDSPVYRFYPEWKQGLKKTITIRHLLNHTSALECVQTDPDGWDPEDVIKYALSASVVDTPGHYFLYNDHGVDLLRGIIERISGQRMDRYIAAALLDPLSIHDYTWEYDKAGTPVNLVITPAEFVKLGQLVLNKGIWNGKQLIAAEWIKQSLEQSQPFVPNYGLLWWRIPHNIIYAVDDELLGQFRKAGVAEDFIQKFSALKGEYKDVNIPDDKLAKVFGDDWKSVLNKELYSHFPRRAKWNMSSDYIGYKAEGWLGQYIVIYPEKKLVACRMIRRTPGYNEQTDGLNDFEKYVYALVK